MFKLLGFSQFLGLCFSQYLDEEIMQHKYIVLSTLPLYMLLRTSL